jgi:hypothetical protein
VVAAQAVHLVAKALQLHNVIEYAATIWPLIHVVAEQIQVVGGAQAQLLLHQVAKSAQAAVQVGGGKATSHVVEV